MGLEDYHVILAPCQESGVIASRALTVPGVADEVRSRWAAIRDDHEAEEYLPAPKRSSEAFLCYDSGAELFQIRIHEGSPAREGRMAIELRFAYCNPRSIYEPFCGVIEWLMERYHLCCHVTRDLGPPLDGKPRIAAEPLRSAADVRPVLMPSMDYNRGLWQLEGWTTEEAPLRPEEALVRFVLPRCQEPRPGRASESPG